MDNLAETSRLGHLRPAGLGHLQTRLDALLLVLKTCVGDVCRFPWKTIFPDGSVSSLADALDSAFDGYFTDLPKVKYSVSLVYFTTMPFVFKLISYSLASVL